MVISHDNETKTFHLKVESKLLTISWKILLIDCVLFLRYGPNILLNSVESYHRPSVWQCLARPEATLEAESQARVLRDFDNSIISGFQLATLSGPMCEEPMMGVCFAVERWEIQSSGKQEPASLKAPSGRNTEKRARTCGDGEDEEAEDGEEEVQATDAAAAAAVDCYGPVSGQLIAAMKDACRHAFQAQPQRLMAAMYTCEIMATSEVLGKKVHITATMILIQDKIFVLKSSDMN